MCRQLARGRTQRLARRALGFQLCHRAALTTISCGVNFRLTLRFDLTPKIFGAAFSGLEPTLPSCIILQLILYTLFAGTRSSATSCILAKGYPIIASSIMRWCDFELPSWKLDFFGRFLGVSVSANAGASRYKGIHSYRSTPLIYCPAEPVLTADAETPVTDHLSLKPSPWD